MASHYDAVFVSHLTCYSSYCFNTFFFFKGFQCKIHLSLEEASQVEAAVALKDQVVDQKAPGKAEAGNP